MGRAMIQAQLISDAHGRWDKTNFHPQAQLILAVGDLADGVEGVDWLIGSGKPCIYVPGNHEHYGGDVGETVAQMQNRAKGSKVVVADRATVIAGPTRFLCATLWTDHQFLDPELSRMSMRSLNDCDHISVSRWLAKPEHEAAYGAILRAFESQNPSARGLFPKKPATMNPAVALALHRQALAFLTTELARPWPGPTVVLSHHAPSLSCLLAAGYHPSVDAAALASHSRLKFKPHRIGSYASDLDYLLANHPVDAWLHGHLHEPVRCSLHGADILNNPTGYADFQNPQFQSEFLIRFPDPQRHAKTLCATIDQGITRQGEYCALLKKAVMGERFDGEEFVASEAGLRRFAKLYNQSIAPLLRQRPKDRQRAGHALEDLPIQRMLAKRGPFGPGSEDALKLVAHDMLVRTQINERRSREWLSSLLSNSVLEGWSPGAVF